MSKLKCPNIKIYKCSDGFVTDNAQVAKSHEANIKSNKLICPFCQQELESVLQLVGAGGLVEEAYLLCSKCNIRGERKLWKELIRTSKALDIAVKRLGYIKNNYKSWTPDRDEQMIAQAVNGLDEIKTALEQKDVK